MKRRSFLASLAAAVVAPFLEREPSSLPPAPMLPPAEHIAPGDSYEYRLTAYPLLTAGRGGSWVMVTW